MQKQSQHPVLSIVHHFKCRIDFPRCDMNSQVLKWVCCHGISMAWTVEHHAHLAMRALISRDQHPSTILDICMSQERRKSNFQVAQKCEESRILILKGSWERCRREGDRSRINFEERLALFAFGNVRTWKLFLLILIKYPTDLYLHIPTSWLLFAKFSEMNPLLHLNQSGKGFVAAARRLVK